MGITIRLAHLTANSIKVNIGDYVKKGTHIGTMGKTGLVVGTYPDHVHIDAANGYITKVWLSHEKKGLPICRNYINVFEDEPKVTNDFGDTSAPYSYDVPHHGIDVIPKCKGAEYCSWAVYSPVNGKIIQILKDDPGYGWCVYIYVEFENSYAQSWNEVSEWGIFHNTCGEPIRARKTPEIRSDNIAERSKWLEDGEYTEYDKYSINDGYVFVHSKNSGYWFAWRVWRGEKYGWIE